MNVMEAIRKKNEIYLSNLFKSTSPYPVLDNHSLTFEGEGQKQHFLKIFGIDFNPFLSIYKC